MSRVSTIEFNVCMQRDATKPVDPVLLILGPVSLGHSDGSESGRRSALHATSRNFRVLVSKLLA